MNKNEKRKIRCHYDVLGIPMNSNDDEIKKSHRKLALKWHPDKNQSNLEEATKEFRLVQEAYECLSDPAERRWYDEHRESILRGWTSSNGFSEDMGNDILFDVTPFMHPSCFSGYDDDERSFYHVYAKVFSELVDEEERMMERDKEIFTTYPIDFGSSSSEYKGTVDHFYASWENFSTKLSFAWVDQYDVRDADNRRVRRAMEDENKKLRKAAKKERDSMVQNLVRFVKKRDPRVRHHKEMVERERRAKQEEAIREDRRKKEENKLAKQKWLEERTKELEAIEQNDKMKGRFRLADELDDLNLGRNRNSRKSKNSKKGKMKNQWGNYDESSSNDDDECDSLGSGSSNAGTKEKKPCFENKDIVADPNDEGVKCDEVVVDEIEDDTSVEEFDVWFCECCKKDFKSQNQLKNHLKSKKHKEAWKKHIKKKEKLIDNDFLNEIS